VIGVDFLVSKPDYLEDYESQGYEGQELAQLAADVFLSVEKMERPCFIKVSFHQKRLQ
jgi:hypothetical protein